MYGKLNRAYLTHSFNTAKHFLGRKYNETKHFIHNVDQGYQLAKKVYSVLSPTIEALAGGGNFSKINQHAMKAISNYENVRNKVMDAHSEATKHVDNVVSNLKKANVSIGLD